MYMLESHDTICNAKSARMNKEDRRRRGIVSKLDMLYMYVFCSVVVVVGY